MSDGTESSADRYFIFSHKEMTAEKFPRLQRSHWAIENNLHWSLDVCFREDNAHIRMGHAAVILNMFRKLVMQMLKRDLTLKGSMAAKRKICSWNFQSAVTLLANSSS